MILVHCLTCKKEFEIPNYYPNHKRGKYCSKKCYWESLKGKELSQKHRENVSKGNKGKQLGHLVSKKTREKIRQSLKNGKFIKCKTCEKRFYVTPSEIKKGKKCCSKKCYTKFQKGKKMPLWQRKFLSEYFKGSNSHFYKGGITKICNSIQSSLAWRLWREAIFERDNWTCQICKIRGKKGLGKRVELHPHHQFISFADLMKKYKINSLEQAINCKHLWIISNGLTLCKRCHKLIHSTNGVSKKTDKRVA